MKALNLLLKINVAAVIVAVFTFGCENVSNPEPISVIDTTQTATINGAAFAELDNGTAGNEPAPEGTKVKVTLDSEDFATKTVPGVQYQPLTYSTTLDATGSFSIEVPAKNEPVTATIYFDNFSADVAGDGVEGEEVFTPSPASLQVQVIQGFTYYDQNVTYN